MSPRWRVWLVFWTGVVALGAGMMLGHGVILAIGLGLAGLSGVGTLGHGREAGVPAPELGGSTDSRAPALPGNWKQTLFGRRRRGGHPSMDTASLAGAGGARLSQLTTRRGHRIVVLDTGRRRRLLVYGPGERPGVLTWAVELDADEADGVATLLQNRAAVGVPAGLERAVAATSEEM